MESRGYENLHVLLILVLLATYLHRLDLGGLDKERWDLHIYGEREREYGLFSPPNLTIPKDFTPFPPPFSIRPPSSCLHFSNNNPGYEQSPS